MPTARSFFGQRAEEGVDGQVAWTRLGQVERVEHPLHDAERLAGRGQVDVPRLHLGGLVHRDHRHGGAAGQDLGQQADPSGILVGHHHEAHAAVDRHGAEELLERLQAPGGSSQPDHQEVVDPGLLPGLGHGRADAVFRWGEVGGLVVGHGRLSGGVG
jgi:hypothetical protein